MDSVQTMRRQKIANRLNREKCIQQPHQETNKKQYQDNFEAVVNEEIYRRTQRRRAIQSNDVVNKIIGE